MKKPKKRRLRNIEFTESCGNVFNDLGLPNPEEALVKAKIVSKICDIIKKRKIIQAKVVKILKISQPKVSLLLRGYLTDFSLERLLRFLNDLGLDVYISIVPSSSHSGHGCTKIGDSPSNTHIVAALRK